MESEDRLDQIVFGWDTDNVADNGGYGPVLYSCDESDARQIFEETRLILRPRGVQGWSSLGRRRLADGRVMVFRRTPLTAKSGPPETFCHALVGDRQVLRPTVSLTLGYWGWPSLAELTEDAVNRRIPALNNSALNSMIEGPRDMANKSFEELSLDRELTVVVAHALIQRDAHLLVLDGSRGHMPVPLLYRMGSVLGAQVCESFSTFESDDTGEWQTAFVREWPVGASRSTVRVDLQERVGGKAESVALRLLECWEEDNETARNLFRRFILQGAGDAISRLDGLAQELQRVGRATGARTRQYADALQQPRQGWQEISRRSVQQAPPPNFRSRPPQNPQRRPPEQPSTALVSVGGYADDYTYDGQFSQPYQAFVAWRAAAGLIRRVYRPGHVSAEGVGQATSAHRALETKLHRRDSHELIALAVNGDHQSTDALGALWRKRAYQSQNDRQHLYATVVGNHLYVREFLRDPNPARVHAGVERAMALFDICVRPHPRGTINDEDLGRLLASLWDEYGALGRSVVTRIIHSDGSLALDDATWRGLFDRALASRPGQDLPGPAQSGGHWRPPPREQAEVKPTPARSRETDYMTRRLMIGLAATLVVAVLVIVVMMVI